MSPRLISPWKRPNSTQYWFRMVVPPRYRQAVGKSEIKQSLGTDNVGEARRLCAMRQSEWLKKFELIELELKARDSRDGVEAVDRYLAQQAEALGNMDRAIAYELEGIAIAEAYHLASPTPEELGLSSGDYHPLVDNPYPAYRDPRTVGMITERRQVLSSVRKGALPGREAVERARHLNFLHIATSAVEEAFAAAGITVPEDDPRFEIAARHFLDVLNSYPLTDLDMMRTSWPTPTAANVPSGLNRSSEADPPQLPENAREAAVVKVDSSSLRQRILATPASARSISKVFDAWAATQPPESKKLCDEWRVSIRRFAELFGDIDVADIDRDMIIDFREAMIRLPSRPKRSISCLPLLEQIDIARDQDLPLLAGATVGKLVTGLRVTLEYAMDPLRLISFNPGSTVKVKGAKSDPDARLPFSPEELQTIFSDPMMTDPHHSASDTKFWLMLLAVLSGLRIEEMGKLRPTNIKCEKGIWYASIERDSRRYRKKETAAGGVNKGAKTNNSYRDVALHSILIDAGFLAYVEKQRQADSEWLFPDLEADQYGSRTKAVSRELIRHIRSLGILDQEKVFHSFRHSMKRACRQTSMKEEIADLLAGHAPDSVGRKYGAGAALDVLRDAVNRGQTLPPSQENSLARLSCRYCRNPEKI